MILFTAMGKEMEKTGLYFVPSQRTSQLTDRITCSPFLTCLPQTERRIVSLPFSKAEVLVIVFTCNHCPTAQAYEDRIIQLTKDYSFKKCCGRCHHAQRSQLPLIWMNWDIQIWVIHLKK